MSVNPERHAVREPFSIVSQYYLASTEDANNAIEEVGTDNEEVGMKNPIALSIKFNDRFVFVSALMRD